VSLLLPLALWPAAASEATTSISDQASCGAAGGDWDSDHATCDLTHTIATGDTLTLSGVTVNADDVSVSSGATLNIDNGSWLANYSGLLSNSGTINVNSRLLTIVAPVTNTASGQINVRSALFVTNTLTNQGAIRVACGASISYAHSGTISGNPPQSSDCTPPSASPTQSPAANASDWNNSDVTANWNWADNPGGWGIDPANCTTSSTSAGEGTTTLTATCVDLAGNQGSASDTVKVDKTPPTISAAATSLPNANGWYNSNVVVHFTCNDGLSGVASCPADRVLSSEGSVVSSTAQTATDAAGNVSAPSNVVTVKVDKTPPTISAAATSLPNANGWYNDDVTVHFTCSDTLSGIPAGACPADQVLGTEDSAVYGCELYEPDAIRK
jgi:hypothetical protein